MRRLRVFDLETIANPKAVAWLDPVKPAANLVDPVKIAKSIEEKTQERNDKLALDWDCCRIVALGWADVGGGDPACWVCPTEEEEAQALTHFWKTYRERDTALVTFNGMKFDIPVLLTRSVDLEVPHPPLTVDKFKTQHKDIWQYLTRGVYGHYPHSLSFYARKYGFTTLDKVAGKDVATLFKAGEFDKIREHCLSDVGLTHALANKFKQLEV